MKAIGRFLSLFLADVPIFYVDLKLETPRNKEVSFAFIKPSRSRYLTETEMGCEITN